MPHPIQNVCCFSADDLGWFCPARFSLSLVETPQLADNYKVPALARRTVEAQMDYLKGKRIFPAAEAMAVAGSVGVAVKPGR
jgi:hypothetical protein